MTAKLLVQRLVASLKNEPERWELSGNGTEGRLTKDRFYIRRSEDDFFFSLEEQGYSEYKIPEHLIWHLNVEFTKICSDKIKNENEELLDELLYAMQDWEEFPEEDPTKKDTQIINPFDHKPNSTWIHKE